MLRRSESATTVKKPSETRAARRLRAAEAGSCCGRMQQAVDAKRRERAEARYGPAPAEQRVGDAQGAAVASDCGTSSASSHCGEARERSEWCGAGGELRELGARAGAAASAAGFIPDRTKLVVQDSGTNYLCADTFVPQKVCALPTVLEPHAYDLRSYIALRRACKCRSGRRNACVSTSEGASLSRSLFGA